MPGGNACAERMFRRTDQYVCMYCTEYPCSGTKSILTDATDVPASNVSLEVWKMRMM